ncbi:hypothetical protein [Microcella alkalica]|uniref:Uncharacterized protein n=1 Tax=Microcella alkalica TaxID=355930 RepID=A0A839EBG4_9MICO|nr:hypothetical protein [Microcella alkalica]MBA8846675.1 hypothetical protein [Microcella alkalica]
MTLREALGGPWATHWMLWLALFPGTLSIVLLRESATPYPQWWWPLLSGVVQHLVAGVILVGGGHLARRRRAILSIWTVAALWVLSCLVRAVVGSAIAEVVAGVPGELLFRAAAWIVMTAAWGPAIVYGFAQIGRRQSVIGELEAARRALEEATAHTAESGMQMRRQLAQTIRRTVAPVLDDLQGRLLTVQQSLDRDAFLEISLRLSRLHDETADLVDSAKPAHGPGESRSRRASLREAFDFPVGRPWLLAAGVSGQTVAIVLPDGARLFGPLAATEIVIAALGGGVALAATIQVSRRSPALRRARALHVTLAAIGAAVLVSSWVMLHSGIDPITWQGAAILPSLGGTLIGSCATVVACLVIVRANEDDERELRRIRSEVDRLEEEHEAAVERERHRLSELMHGPVQGRIAACVMALTFFSDADAAPGALASVTDQVLDHLAAASHDLSLLAEGRPPDGGA